MTPPHFTTRLWPRLLRSLVLLCLLGGGAGALAAPSLVIDDLSVRRGQVAVSVHLVEAFNPETRHAIAQGLPITIRFTTELWRERSHWFDKQVDSRVKSFRVRYHPGERLFSLTEQGHNKRRQTFATLGRALDEVSRRRLAVHPRWELEEHRDYFVTLEAAIQPLTLAEFRELEGWISGRIRRDDAPAESSPKKSEDGGGISGAFFDLLVDLSGFGDTIFRARTSSFRPSELPATDRRSGVAPAHDLD